MANDTQIAIRMPSDLRRWIEQEAAKDDRSASYYIVRLLKRAREQAEAERLVTGGNGRRATPSRVNP